ncbi:hypothetical protein D3C74_53290 [compost metagenome]
MFKRLPRILRIGSIGIFTTVRQARETKSVNSEPQSEYGYSRDLEDTDCQAIISYATRVYPVALRHVGKQDAYLHGRVSYMHMRDLGKDLTNRHTQPAAYLGLL